MSSWVDLSKVGVVLGRVVEQGRVLLAAIDTEKNEASLDSLGLRPRESLSGLWVLPAGIAPPTPRQLRDTFGDDNVSVVEIDNAEIDARFDRARALRARIAGPASLPAADINAVPLGTNHAGMTVYDSSRGRFFRMKAPKGGGAPVTVYETSASSTGGTLRQARPSAFLYADKLSDLPLVADGFVRRAVQGEHLTQREFNKLIQVSGAGLDGSSMSRRDVQEAVEGATGRAFARLVAKNSDPEFGYRLALRLYDSIPTQNERTASSVGNQQFSTPWPISFLAQRILGNTTGKSVLEPTIGNRSLVSALPSGTSVYGLELDRKRLELFGKDVVVNNTPTELVGDATQAEFRTIFGQFDGFDCVIANPPFGSLERAVNLPVSSPLLQGLETKRLDHLILLRSLAARKDDGRAVYIVGADNAIEVGVVKGRTKWLMNYLNDHYDLHGVADIAGNLYQKMGAAYPIRLLVIGSRKAAPVHEADFPVELPVLTTHKALKDWVDELVARIDPAAAIESQAAETLSTPTQQVAQAAAPVEDEQTERAPGQQSDVAEQPTIEAALEGDIGDDEVKIVEDDFQRRYEPFSKVGEGTTMIPVNLAGPVYEALQGIQTRYGDIDDFVCAELEFNTRELSGLFSPEQVDALALAIAAKKDGRGFMLADQMGVGKGRTLAAMARHAILHGETPIFVTVKPNLFSDFLERDLEDIRSRHLFKQPFIFNADTKIMNRSGVVTVTSPKPADYKRVFESGKLPEGTDIAFLTYSQLARDPGKSNRAKLFLDVTQGDGVALLLDESHNGAGESYTSENLCVAIHQSGGSVTYSSGTPIKGAKNLKLYQRVLPRGVDYDGLLEVIQKDPISLQEALNHEIALTGCLISRELDNRAVSKDFVVSQDTERNRKLSDDVSAILMTMSYLSGDVENLVKERQSAIKDILKTLPKEDREGSRMGVSSMNFGSRFHAISRQFLLAVKADDAVKEAVAAIERGEKPIIAVQHTGESLLLSAVNSAKEDAGEEAQATALGRTVVLDRPITFKDLLHRYSQKILLIKETGHYGAVTVRKANSKETLETVAHIKQLIDQLPNDLPLTPLDYFKHQMGIRGYKVGEISGRSLEAKYLDGGGIAVEPVNNTDKSKVVQLCKQFNDGELDAILLTASGSTGISLQASPANGRDLRPRRMVKWEPQQDIAVERQMDGRHNRTGQVVPPKYSVLLSGLPADDRLAMMFNNKNRSLTSATVSNRDSKDLITTVPDLLNEVGDHVACRMFIEDPNLAQMMDVEISEEDELPKPTNYYISRMTGRIMLLPYDKQVALYGELGKRFNERIEELTALGENPLQVKCHDWKAKVIDRKVFFGEEQDENNKSKSQFDAPVYLTTINYEREMKPLRVDELKSRVSAGRAMLCEHALVGSSGSLAEIRMLIADRSDKWLRDSVSVFKFPNGDVAAALAHPEPNETKTLKDKLTWLVERVEHVAPGNIFRLEQENGDHTPFVIVGLQIPGEEDFKRLGTWGVYAIRPGHDKVETFSLNALFTQKAMVTGSTIDTDSRVRNEFDSCPNGKVTMTERILDGNIFEAVAATLRHKLGRKIVYTDESGIRQHGVLLKSGMSMEYLNRSVAERLKRPDEVMWYLDVLQRKGVGWEGLSSDATGNARSTDAVRLSKTDAGDYVITVPGTKAGGGHVFLDPRIAKIEGRTEQSFGLSFEGTRSAMRAYVKPVEMRNVLDYLMNTKNIGIYTGDRDLLKLVRTELKAHAERSEAKVTPG